MLGMLGMLGMLDMIEAPVTRDGKTTTVNRHYLSSAAMDAVRPVATARGPLADRKLPASGSRRQFR